MGDFVNFKRIDLECFRYVSIGPDKLVQLPSLEKLSIYILLPDVFYTPQLKLLIIKDDTDFRDDDELCHEFSSVNHIEIPLSVFTDLWEEHHEDEISLAKALSTKCPLLSSIDIVLSDPIDKLTTEEASQVKALTIALNELLPVKIDVIELPSQ